MRFVHVNVRIGYVVAEEAERLAWNGGEFSGDKFARCPGLHCRYLWRLFIHSDVSRM